MRLYLRKVKVGFFPENEIVQIISVLNHLFKPKDATKAQRLPAADPGFEETKS